MGGDGCGGAPVAAIRGGEEQQQRGGQHPHRGLPRGNAQHLAHVEQLRHVAGVHLRPTEPRLCPSQEKRTHSPARRRQELRATDVPDDISQQFRDRKTGGESQLLNQHLLPHAMADWQQN